jgi:hypothetical protein
MWLDAALTEHLRPVEAPGELWERVYAKRYSSQYEPARTARGPVRWKPVMASALAIVTAAALWGVHDRGTLGGAFRSAELNSSAELHSNDALSMRAWVKSRAGLDIPLVASSSPSIRLASVRLGEHSLRKSPAPTAEVSFLVQDRRATLLVSPAESGSSGMLEHRLLTTEPYNSGAKTASWVVRGQLYTLACASPEDLRTACSLCHEAGAL